MAEPRTEPVPCSYVRYATDRAMGLGNSYHQNTERKWLSREPNQQSLFSCPVRYRLRDFELRHKNLKYDSRHIVYRTYIPVRIYSNFWMLWCLPTVFNISLHSQVFVININHFQPVASLYWWTNADNNDQKMMKNDEKKQNLILSAIPTSRRENNKLSRCPNSYFAQGQFRD